MNYRTVRLDVRLSALCFTWWWRKLEERYAACLGGTQEVAHPTFQTPRVLNVNHLVVTPSKAAFAVAGFQPRSIPCSRSQPAAAPVEEKLDLIGADGQARSRSGRFKVSAGRQPASDRRAAETGASQERLERTRRQREDLFHRLAITTPTSVEFHWLDGQRCLLAPSIRLKWKLASYLLVVWDYGAF